MKTVPIQTSFAGGEISPKLRGRVDTELWKKGLDYCENFEPLAHGPLLSRGGTRMTYLFPDLTDKSRLEEFPRQGKVGFQLLMGENKLRVRSGLDGSQVVAGAIDWLLNPFFLYGWNYWDKYPALGTDPNDAFGIANGQYYLGAVTGALGQETVALVAGTYTLTVSYSSVSGHGLIVRVGTTLHGFDLVDGSALDSTGLSDVKTKTFSVTVSVPGPVFVEVYKNTATGYEDVGTFPATNRLVEIALRTPSSGDAVWDTTTTPAMPWSDDQLEELQVIAEPAQDRMMFFHPAVAPHELVYTEASDSWAFRAITFTFTLPADPDWESPNFPSVAELYQGRLLVGGIPGRMNTLLGSKSGEPYDFTLGTNANDAFSLDVSTKGAMRWLQGHRSLLLGTDRGEHVVIAQGGVLTPSDFEVRPQSGFGAANVQALNVGDLAMYVSRDRRRIRMLSFNLQENGYQARDLTFTGEHLTSGLIKELDWLSTGNDQVLALMRSGEVMCWTFNRGEQVVAPWRATFGGAVYSICVLEAGDQDKVWMLVQRVGGVALEEWLVADDPERCLLDSYANARPAAGVAGGFTWLAGKEVIAIVDGIPTPPQTVTAGGEVTVSEDAASVTVGIFSPRTFTTLPRDVGPKLRMVKARLSLNDSAIPFVNEDRAEPDRTPETSMGEMEPRMTGVVTAKVMGFEDGGTITVSQDKPLRTEVLALFGVVVGSEV